MEKVKLPREICDILDKLLIEYEDEESVCWYIFQNKYYPHLKEEYIAINHFADRGNSLKLAQAILHGYEPDETEKEREEREFKEKMIKSLRSYLQGRIKYQNHLQKYAEEIYELFNKTM